MVLFQGPRVTSPQEDVDRDGQVQLTADVERDLSVAEDTAAEGIEVLCDDSNSCADVNVFKDWERQVPRYLNFGVNDTNHPPGIS